MSKNVTHNKKIVWEWGKPLGTKDNIYAYRWRLDFYFFSFRIHKWLCSDDMRAYHSHPVNMIIFILFGVYVDHYLDEEGNRRSKEYRSCDFRFIPRNFRHYVEVKTDYAWTILFTWGEPKRWGFWLKDTLKRKNRDKYFIEHGHHVCD